MVKIIFFIVCLIAAFCGSSTLTVIECNYDDTDYFVVGEIYECKVNNDPIIRTKESAQISGVSGTHKASKNNDDVTGIYAYGQTIQVFPKDLNNFFKSLKAIWIFNCQLKEIHQSDLKVFPNLVYFDLYRNRVEIIEAGLFDFNPNLQLIGIQESKIIHIDPNVFDHLTKLSNFWFYSVPCVDQTISNSTDKVQEAIKIVKSNCSNSEFLSLDNQIKNLEIESKTLNSEDFHTKLESFEKSFNKSKFSKFRPLNYKFQNLKSSYSSTQFDQVQNSSILDPNNVNNLKNVLKNITDTFEDLKASHDQMSKTLTDLKTDMDTKIDMSIDSKLKLVESRLMNKIDEKFNKVLKALNVEN